MSLVAAARGIGQVEAAKALAIEMGTHALEPITMAAPRPSRGRIVESYDYLGPDGQVVFQVTRWEPKTFTQRRADGKGGWVASVKGIQLIPYRLPEVIRAQAVFIVEGEKDANNLAALGLTATCNAQGAGKWKSEYNQWFAGKRVYILADNDDPGRAHAEQVAQALHGTAEAVKIVELPGLPPKGDVSDWLTAGGTQEALLEMVKAAPTWNPADGLKANTASQPSQIPRAFRFLSLKEILAAPCPTKWLIRGYLEADTLAVLFGEPGSMKSFLAIDQGLCVAAGVQWHGHAVPNPGPVFYLAGEGFNGLAKRVMAWTIVHRADPDAVPFFVSSAPAQLLDEEHAQTVVHAVEALTEQYGPPRLVVIDTLNRNFGNGDENSSQDMTAFVAALDRLKARFGCAVLVCHHSGLATKDRSRGSSVLRAAADFEYKLIMKDPVRVLSCTKIKDHEPPADMAFEPKPVGTCWTDHETLQEITSCVLRLTGTPKNSGEAELTGAKRICYDALLAVCERAGGACHVSEWREEAYKRSISTSGSEARKKAFKRATEDLETSGLIKNVGKDLWQPAKWELGTKGTCPPPVMSAAGTTGTPL